MKGIYLAAAVMLLSTSAYAVTESKNGTVTDGWLTVEDFQSKKAGEKMEAWNVENNPIQATVSIVEDAKDANNLAVKCEKGNYGDLVVIPVTLANGKKLSDYKTIQFDIYRYGGDSNYKRLFIYVDNEKVFASENEPNWSEVGEWTTYSFPIPDGLGCADQTTVNLQIGIRDGAYALDNVKLKEKGDGSATASTNGTVTDGWLMAEDFQNKTVGDVMNTWDYTDHDTGLGTCTIVAEPNKAENMMANFVVVEGDYNTLIEVPVTLPEGKTIADYEAIKFDIYRFRGDDNHKYIAVFIDNAEVKIDAQYIERAPENGWKTWEYPIPASVTSENQILIRLGIKSNLANYAIDNIQLKERAVLPPVEYDATTNGTVTEKKLMVNDFQDYRAPGVKLGSWTRGDSAEGNVATAEDPENRKNLVGSFSGTSNYETVMEIPVTLPEGKTLKDYDQISFKLYRCSNDADNKKMRVQADDYVIHYDENYPQQALKGVWTEKTYPIEQNEVGNTFNLRLGIESNEPHYLIDNVMLQVRDVQSGINRVSDAGMSVAVDGNSLIIMAAPEMEINVYSIDGQLSGTMTGEGSIELKHGVYIVTAAGKSVKIIL